MTSRGDWDSVLGELRGIVERKEVASVRALAAELGVGHGTLLRILSGETGEPQPRTRGSISEWVRRRREGPAVQTVQRGDGAESPEQALLEFFLQNDRQLATFMETTTEGLSVEDRRTVALAILNGFKRLAIQAGEPIPATLYDIERRFVAE